MIAESQPRRDSVDFTRHSKALYKTYAEILASEHPDMGIDAEQQLTPDLNESGVILAREKASELLNTYNPQEDALFFVSSNEARALETGNIYREVAHERGFEVMAPENVRGQLAQQIGDGEIRVLKNLSVNLENMLSVSVFNLQIKEDDINWTNIDPEIKSRWREARKVIAADDKGSFGSNFFHYSEIIQKFFPELQTAREVYETQFQNLLRLVRFALKKIEASSHPKNIKVLAFGHENYVGYALNKYFQDHAIANCETLHITLEDEQLQMQRRGEKIVIE
jgi:hypothetical protein